jgi:hypothetical protein
MTSCPTYIHKLSQTQAHTAILSQIKIIWHTSMHLHIHSHYTDPICKHSGRCIYMHTYKCRNTHKHMLSCRCDTLYKQCLEWTSEYIARNENVKHPNRKHTYRHTHAHTYRHTWMHTYIHTYVRTYVRTNIQANTHTCMYTYIYTCTQTYIQAYMHAYIHTYIISLKSQSQETQSYPTLSLNIRYQYISEVFFH